MFNAVRSTLHIAWAVNSGRSGKLLWFPSEMISIKMVVLFHMENVGGFLLLVSFFLHWGCTPIRRSASADVQVTGRMAKFQKGTGGIRWAQKQDGLSGRGQDFIAGNGKEKTANMFGAQLLIAWDPKSVPLCPPLHLPFGAIREVPGMTRFLWGVWELKPAPNQFYAFPVEKHRDVGLSLGHPLCSSTTTRATCWPHVGPIFDMIGWVPSLRMLPSAQESSEIIIGPWVYQFDMGNKIAGVKMAFMAQTATVVWGSNTPIHSNCGHRVLWSLPLSWIWRGSRWRLRSYSGESPCKATRLIGACHISALLSWC